MMYNPAVSVVIPMYNAEKYIGECLDSLLKQTLQDYEIILVNDYSTDNSRQIAKSYLEKFGGRLKIHDNEKNSGPSVTRNNGLRLACGEYIFFMDSDDLLASIGLEEMYSLAKKFDADVVNCTMKYNISENGKERVLILNSIMPRNLVMVEDDLGKRIQILLDRGFSWGIWRRFFRRSFLLENELFFLDKLHFAEDDIWMYGVFFCAKKIVHVSRAYYYYRTSENSLIRSNKSPVERTNRWVGVLIQGINWINGVMDKQEFFAKNPELRYAILENLSEKYFNNFFKNSLKIRPNDFFKAVTAEIENDLQDKEVSVANLFAFINIQKKKITQLEEQLNKK